MPPAGASAAHHPPTTLAYTHLHTHTHLVPADVFHYRQSGLSNSGVLQFTRCVGAVRRGPSGVWLMCQIGADSGGSSLTAGNGPTAPRESGIGRSKCAGLGGGARPRRRHSMAQQGRPTTHQTISLGCRCSNGARGKRGWLGASSGRAAAATHCRWREGGGVEQAGHVDWVVKRRGLAGSTHVHSNSSWVQ